MNCFHSHQVSYLLLMNKPDFGAISAMKVFFKCQIRPPDNLFLSLLRALFPVEL